MLVVVALWGIPALIQTHGEFFRVGIGRHVIERSFMTFEGHGASSFGIMCCLLPFYFVTVFISFFPWSIKLPWLIRKLWQIAESVGQRVRLRRKLRYLSVLGHRGRLRHLHSRQHEVTALHVAGVSNACAFACTTLASRSTSSKVGLSLFARIAVATACVWIAIALVVPPLVPRFFPAFQLFQVSRASLQPNMQFAAVEFQEPSLVWYFRSRVEGFLTPLNKRRAAEFMSAPDPRFIVLPTAVAGELFANPPASWRFFTSQWFQHRERQTSRSHAGVKIRVSALVRGHQFVVLRFFSTATSRSTSSALRLGGGMLVPLANALGLDRNCFRVASVQIPSLLRSEAL